jgi:uncharacterized membrane protein
MSAERITDQKIEIIIGTLLRAGVLLSATVVAIGTCIYLVRHGREAPDFGTFHGEPENLQSIPAILHGALDGSGRAIIQLGLLLLIATPIARVVFSAVAFALERDYLYVGITLVVLAVLLYSLLGPSP